MGVWRKFLAYPRKAKWLSPRNAGTTPTISSSISQGENNMIETESVMVVMDCWTSRPIGLNHDQAVRGLHPRPLQPVIENRILIGQQVQAGGVLHHPNADVARVLVGQQRIGVVDGPDEHAIENGEGKLGRDQPPEAGLHRLVGGDGVDDARQ